MNIEQSFISALLILGGGWLLSHSLIKYKLRRRIYDLPYSKLISAAIGSNVKVKAMVVDPREEATISPLTQRKGTAFLWRLEILRDGGRRSDYWETVHLFHSTPYLYIHDNEGAVAAVDFSACEFQENNFDPDPLLFSEDTENIPPIVKKIFLNDEVISSLGGYTLWTKKQFRLSEKMFITNESLFLLGYVSTSPESEKRELSDLSKVLMKIQSDIFETSAMNPLNQLVQKAKILFTHNTTDEAGFNLDKVYVYYEQEDDFRWNLRMNAFLTMAFAYFLIAAGLFVLFSSLV